MSIDLQLSPSQYKGFTSSCARLPRPGPLPLRSRTSLGTKDMSLTLLHTKVVLTDSHAPRVLRYLPFAHSIVYSTREYMYPLLRILIFIINAHSNEKTMSWYKSNHVSVSAARRPQHNNPIVAAAAAAAAAGARS